MTTSIEFFDRQFEDQVLRGQYKLNKFEQMTQPYLRGDVLDFGCGLGNLAVAAAESGCRVFALDAAPTAIANLQRMASERGLAIKAVEADLRSYRIEDDYDAVVSIGLLMFFDRDTALTQLTRLKEHVRPGGVASVNVLIEGTTFLDMFGTGPYYLFRKDELAEAFWNWDILVESFSNSDAPNSTVKSFVTIIAQRPR